VILSSGSTLRSRRRTSIFTRSEAVGCGGCGEIGEEMQRGGSTEHKEEEERRRAAVYREEREKRLERVCHVKAAMVENPDALRKGKWPRCT
jgi:hypothetical protein